MENVFVQRSIVDDTNDEAKALKLLVEHENLEVMVQSIDADSFVWITPNDNENSLEFFYIISGRLTLESDGEKLHLNEGDSFHISELKHDIILKSHVPLKILYVSTVPLYDYLDCFSNNLEDALKQIEEKDNYTYRHCKRVMDYSVKIAVDMNIDSVSIDNIAIAAAFHDVGKCLLNDDILNKKSKLTHDEFLQVMKHPLNSAKMLKKSFNKSVLSIVEAHHERLDGSGYPYGLEADEIPIEAKIISVADSFDAMTSKRPYNIPKRFDEAVYELETLDDKYDIDIVHTLKKLIENKEIIGEDL